MTEAESEREIKVHTHGFVRLVATLPTTGIDAHIVACARTSTQAKGDASEVGVRRLIRYMIAHDHASPFEFATLQFRVRAPIFTARQWMRHRTQSYSEMSARYGPLPDAFYHPPVVRKQSLSNMQGGTEPADAETAAWFDRALTEMYASVDALYREALRRGIAREQARIVMPVATYTEFMVSVNLRNLLHFIHLRMDPHAQEDIRAYASAMYQLAREAAPITVNAFDDYVRDAITLSAPQIRWMRGEDDAGLSAREQADLSAKLDACNMK